ncbi:hypothetical protein GQ568_02245, partial [Patescibacteria group bacterium]|nr:hypothetical protein [Patescibacteria group bacterium]
MTLSKLTLKKIKLYLTKIMPMGKNNLVILKIGGSVITDKKNNKKTIDQKVLKRIIKEIAQAKSKKDFSLIIIHGVGTFGHKIAKKFDLQNGYKDRSQIRAISSLCLDLKKLNIEILKHLKRANINAIAFEQSSAWEMTNGRLYNCNLSIINKHLELNLTPILYGDILIDKKLKFSILSGDQIIYYLAKKLNADKVVMGTDIDGVFDCDPKINKNAKLVKLVNKNNFNKLSISGSTAIDVTDGMRGKV